MKKINIYTVLLMVTLFTFVNAHAYESDLMPPSGPYVINEASKRVSMYALDGSTKVVSGTTALKVHSQGELSILNSSVTPLAGDATFTGSAEDILDEAVVIVTVYSDVASADFHGSITFRELL